MAAGQDFREQMRILLRLFADDEERRPRIESIEEIEHRSRVDRGGAVIDSQPDFRLVSLERLDNRSEPLAIRRERRVEQQDVRQENRRERDDDVEAHQIKAEAWGQESERQKKAPGPAEFIEPERGLHSETPKSMPRQDSSRRR